MPSNSLYLEYGGDFVLSDTGSLKIATDTPYEATSTLQRVQRLMFTNPRIRDSYGNVLARGDSIQYPDYGVGLPKYVDASVTDGLISELQAAILYGLSQDPGILRSPAPVINVAFDGLSRLSISITFTSTSGQVITTPAYDLSGGTTS